MRTPRVNLVEHLSAEEDRRPPAAVAGLVPKGADERGAPPDVACLTPLTTEDQAPTSG